MSLFPTIYEQVHSLLKSNLPKIHEGNLKRVTLLVIGMIEAKSASPARIAQAIEELGLRDAKASSIERIIRRIENDEQVEASVYFHPFARARLLYGRPKELILVIDPTTQDDRLVMVSISIWYRGRALPLAWAIWPGNKPLEGDGFWTRIESLLDIVGGLLPKHIPVTWLADRAFGTPAFIDLLTARGWHYVVRVQGHTRCQDQCSVERQIQHLIHQKGQRAKMHGQAFKKYGWRTVSIVVYWGRRHKDALCLVCDLPPVWQVIHLYRRRYSIEATFRDYKSSGLQWEQGQVVDEEHVKRLLTCMALATWIAIYVGSQVAQELLNQPPTGRRKTIPWEGKRSLFTLGIQRLHKLFNKPSSMLLHWQLTDWDAPNWQSQIYFHHARAFVLGANHVSHSA